jgi:hypothetical protein
VKSNFSSKRHCNIDTDMTKDCKVAGLKYLSNGRSSVSYRCCGEYLQKDSLVSFRSSVAEVNVKIEEAVSVIRVRNKFGSCKIGFLPRNIVKATKEKLVCKFAQIIELHICFERNFVCNTSHKNRGMASFRLLEDFPQEELKNSH